MLEKPLTEADWKKFSKDRGYKDAALLKALGALAKADEMAPDDQLKALEAVEKEVAALLKSVRGDKELTAHVPLVQAALKKQRKAAELAAEAAAKAAEEPASALLDPKKLLDQLNQCKRKPDRSVQFGYVDGKEKAPAVLAMHPTMSGRSLMAKLQDLVTAGNTVIIVEHEMRIVIARLVGTLSMSLSPTATAMTRRQSARARNEKGEWFMRASRVCRRDQGS